MTAQDHSLLAELLEVQAPWVITEVRWTARPSGPLTVHVEHVPATGRAWSARKDAPPCQWLRWSHVSLAGVGCQISLALRDGQQIPNAVWTGEPDAPFTRKLARHALNLLLEGVTMEQLCSVLQVPFTEVWKFKFRVDQTPLPAPEADRSAAPRSGPPRSLRPTTPVPTLTQIVPSPPGAVRMPNLPAQASPVWAGLLVGRWRMDVRVLGLRLLLSHWRREISATADREIQRRAVLAVHGYFAKNLKLLTHELSQLERLALAGAGDEGLT